MFDYVDVLKDFRKLSSYIDSCVSYDQVALCQRMVAKYSLKYSHKNLSSSPGPLDLLTLRNACRRELRNRLRLKFKKFEAE